MSVKGNIGGVLDSKFKYTTFGYNVEFKNYLHGFSDCGSRLLLDRGQNGLNEGRLGGR